MTFENISSLATTIGGGFISGYLVAYFLRRILKLLMFIIGGILALLLFLQHQEIIAINVTKLQTYTEGIFASILNTTAATNLSSTHIPIIKYLDHFGI
jgi:uncharacterized membrane protein (Fun14 family)